MKIGFASRDWSPLLGPDMKPSWGGSGWYRCGLPARYLRRTVGLDAVEGTLTFSKGLGVFGVREWPVGEPDSPDAVIHWDVDLIVLQRWMFASVAVETETARRKGQVVVQDVDDHFWALHRSNQAWWSSHPKLNPTENRDLYLKGLQRATAVTTSTPYLADELRRLGVPRERIHVLENRVEVDAFEPGPQNRRPPRLGWVGAIPWRSGDVETLKGVLRPVVERHGLQVIHGGHMERAASFANQAGLLESSVVTFPFAPVADYPDFFQWMDVGLVPLQDLPFNRAKSWVKGLEYAAAGVPFVAQDLPEYVRLHARYGIGRLAHRRRDWVRHLDALVTDHEGRREEAEANRSAVKALDILQGVDDWVGLYLELLANPG